MTYKYRDKQTALANVPISSDCDFAYVQIMQLHTCCNLWMPTIHPKGEKTVILNQEDKQTFSSNAMKEKNSDGKDKLAAKREANEHD